MTDEHVIHFKSALVNYDKEELGVKNNTVLKVSLSDDRFQALAAWCHEIKEYTRSYVLKDKFIEISLAEDPKACFKRNIQDITWWEDLVIITWKHEEVAE